MKSILTKLAMAAITLFGAANLMAQADSGHGVARISLIHGDVSTQRGDSGDTAAAALNAPIVTGDKISTGDNSRAEVQLDFANILRLNGHSQANIASLTDKEIQIQVSQGSATYTAFKTSEVRPEVDTANLSVRPSKGDVSFRIEAISPDETEVTVRKGEAEVSTSSGSQQVRKGEMIVVRGSGADAQFKVEDARNRDDWDKWNDDRDHLISNAESVHRTSPYYTGSQDLDAYGHWTEMPDYGSVWVPSVSVGWVPYRDGRWVWEPYYGWTWVSYEPWGWAPYHYGRWFYSGASWVWWPGPVGGYGRGYGYGGGYYRPVWAPAYVSFFGFGGGVGVGVGFGSFGWLPIGPCDSFRPWYGGRYGGRFNQVNITNIYNNGGRGDRFRDEGFRGERALYQGRGRQYSNLRLAGTDPHIRGAISAVPAEHFGSGRVAARGIDPGSFREAKLMTGNLPVVPTRESLNASNRAASPGAFRGAQQQRFFGTNRQTSSPQSFDRQAAQVQQSIQRDGHFTPIRSGESAGGRNLPANGQAGNNPATRGGENPSLQGRSPGNQGGQRIQNPERGASSPGRTPTNQSARSDARIGGTEQQGWRRFGGPAAGPASDRAGAAVSRSAPMNRGPVSQPESRSSGRDQAPTRGAGASAPSNGGGWQRFPSPSNRGAGPVDRGNAGSNDRVEGPSSNNGGGWNRGPRPEPSNPGNGGANGRNQVPSSGSGGWDRGPRPEAPRNTGSPDRGSAPRGDYGRGASRPTLDMRQPVVTPRSQSPSYGGGRMEAPRPSGGGGRSEAPRPSGGGGRPSGGGGGGRSGGRPPGGGHRG
jgi:FecR protein